MNNGILEKVGKPTAFLKNNMKLFHLGSLASCAPALGASVTVVLSVGQKKNLKLLQKSEQSHIISRTP